MSSIDSKRIAKNTFYLYLRMLMVMIVSLYSVRIILNALGAEDYGINNVVGGIVTMFTFLTSTLNSASLRFFSYNIGKKDLVGLSQYFTMSFWCYIILGLIAIFLAETVGLWFVYNKLVIPEERMTAALWVYQFSIITFAFKLIAVPYNSIVIAHEKMDMYAALGVLECFLKLGVAYLIVISPFDKLITYGALLCIMMLSIDCFYIIYGIRNFKESRVRLYWDRKKFKEIANYSSWSLFGAISGVVRSQGINILLNVFFNPVINAARAIAFQINTQINQFVLNFYKAVQPQITKSYGSGDFQGMHTLVLRSSRFCFYLIYIISMPVLFETEYILTFWLKHLPDYSVLFSRLVIINAIVDSLSYPLQTTVSATGKIKLYQFITGGLLIINLPISWLLLKLNYPPQATMYISISVSILAQAIRLIFVKKLINLDYVSYVKEVLIPISLVVVISSVLPAFIYIYINEGLQRFVYLMIVTIFASIFAIWSVGIKQNERLAFKNVLYSKLHFLKRNK